VPRAIGYGHAPERIRYGDKKRSLRVIGLAYPFARIIDPQRSSITHNERNST
jgi:hypothetical protein